MHFFAEENPIFLKHYALVAGSNTGTEDRVELKYAISDAEAFKRVLLTMGGVGKEDLIIIKNPSLTDYINETMYARLRWDGNQLLHVKNTLVTGFQFAKHFSIWGGPTLNVYLSSEDKDKKFAYWDIKFKEFKPYWYAIWPGFMIGMEF